jgi:hypothetical protein
VEVYQLPGVLQQGEEQRLGPQLELLAEGHLLEEVPERREEDHQLHLVDVARLHPQVVEDRRLHQVAVEHLQEEELQPDEALVEEVLLAEVNQQKRNLPNSKSNLPKRLNPSSGKELSSTLLTKRPSLWYGSTSKK